MLFIRSKGNMAIQLFMHYRSYSCHLIKDIAVTEYSHTDVENWDGMMFKVTATN